MFRRLINKIVLVLVSWLLVIAPTVLAQPYHPFYWISGSVNTPSGISSAGRQVVLYDQPLANNTIVGGYADDLVGPTGLAGVDDKYTVNAFKYWPFMAVEPGRYYVAIVNDNPSNPAAGYGADPVEVNLTGVGYDIAPTLILALGAGPGAPGAPPSVFGSPPHINNITFGNRKYQTTLVAQGQEFIVAAKPRVSARAVSSFGLNVSSIAMVLNEGTANAKTYQIGTANIVRAAGPTDAPTEVDFTYDFQQENQALPEGVQNISFRAANAFGSTSEVCAVTVAGGEPRLVGVPITFPSPLHLKTDREVFFQYTLTHDIPVEINVFDVSGKIVLRKNVGARQEGGSAGVNKVAWNLQTDQGTLVSSGIYVFTLINKENGKLLGKGKFTALP